MCKRRCVRLYTHILNTRAQQATCTIKFILSNTNFYWLRILRTALNVILSGFLQVDIVINIPADKEWSKLIEFCLSFSSRHSLSVRFFVSNII